MESTSIRLLVFLGVVLLACGITGTLVHRYDAGQEAERNLANARQYAEAITTANEQRLAAEEQSQEQLSASQARFQHQLKETTDHANATIADLRNGIIRLRVAANGTTGTGGVPQGTGPDSGPAAASTCYASTEFSTDVGQRLKKYDDLQIAYNVLYERAKTIPVSKP